jgi:hypothetical protein
MKSTDLIKGVLDNYADKQVNIASEVLRVQLADEIHRALRLSNVISTTRNDCELFKSRYR